MNRIKVLACCCTLLMAILTAGFSGPACQAADSPQFSDDSLEKESSILHDPIEDDPQYSAVFETIDAEVAELLKDHPMRGAMGFCHIIWEEKKRILKEKYGINWRSPAEMNPHVLFD